MLSFSQLAGSNSRRLVHRAVFARVTPKRAFSEGQRPPPPPKRNQNWGSFTELYDAFYSNDMKRVNSTTAQFVEKQAFLPPKIWVKFFSTHLHARTPLDKVFEGIPSLSFPNEDECNAVVNWTVDGTPSISQKEIGAYVFDLMLHYDMKPNRDAFSIAMEHYYRTMKYQRVIEMFTMMTSPAFNYVPTNFPVNRTLGSYIRLGEYDKALQLYEEAKQNGIPLNKYTYYWVMLIFMKTSLWDSALSFWRELKAMSAAKFYLRTVYHTLLMELLAQKQLDAAIEVFRDCVAFDVPVAKGVTMRYLAVMTEANLDTAEILHYTQSIQGKEIAEPDPERE